MMGHCEVEEFRTAMPSPSHVTLCGVRTCHNQPPLFTLRTQATFSSPTQSQQLTCPKTLQHTCPYDLQTMLELLHHVASLYHSISHIANTFGDAHDEMTTSPFHRATETVEFLRAHLPEQLARPRVAIVCGSGLGGLAATINEGLREEWQYKDVPNFPLSTGK